MLGCASLQTGHYGQVAPPNPTFDGVDDNLEAPIDGAAGPTDAEDGPQSAPGAPAEPAASGVDTGPDTDFGHEPDDVSSPGATQWLERAFSLWHDGHFAASIDAMHEALSTQDLNDAGKALAYWHVYLAQQALGHTQAGQGALADFVAVADDIMTALVPVSGVTGADNPNSSAAAFAQQFDLKGRLARARAILNLAWAQQTHRAGFSEGHPVLVFNDAEMDHFLDLAPPCAHHSDRKVVAVRRQRDHLGRPTAQATLRCRQAGGERHYYFAFIGPKNLAAASAEAAAQ